MMRQFLQVTLTLALACTGSFGALTVLEDFEALNPGTVDMQHEIIDWGLPIEMWNTQANRVERHPIDCSTVVSEAADGGQCMKMVNVGHRGEIDTIYTCVYFGNDNAIDNLGTVYMQFKADGPNDNVMGLNDLYEGYPSDVYGDTVDDPLYQGMGAWAYQATDIRLSADTDLRCRNGSIGYEAYDMGIESNKWYELWIQFDCPNKKVRFYVCEGGQTAQMVPSPDSTGWWDWWNGSYNNTRISSIKWHNGMYPWPVPDDATPTTTWIDNIAVDTEGHSLTSFFPEIPEGHPGDADLDDDVDITDFLILKSNYGTQQDATWSMGDFDGDEDVDISDFLILKANYGWVSSN